MRLIKLTAALAIAALPLMAAPTYAQSAGDPSGGDSSSSPSQIGRQDLGVDLSQAGNTPFSVKRFVAGQPGDTQMALVDGCHIILAYPATAEADTVHFCELLNS